MPQSVSGTCPCAISLVSSTEDWLGALRMLSIQDVQQRFGQLCRESLWCWVEEGEVTRSPTE